jgi:hypothetical protein
MHSGLRSSLAGSSTPTSSLAMAASLPPAVAARLRWLGASSAGFIGRRDDHNFRARVQTIGPVNDDLITRFKA